MTRVEADKWQLEDNQRRSSRVGVKRIGWVPLAGITRRLSRDSAAVRFTTCQLVLVLDRELKNTSLSEVSSGMDVGA